jgi:hypothetical protein
MRGAAEEADDDGEAGAAADEDGTPAADADAADEAAALLAAAAGEEDASADAAAFAAYEGDVMVAESFENCGSVADSRPNMAPAATMNTKDANSCQYQAPNRDVVAAEVSAAESPPLAVVDCAALRVLASPAVVSRAGLLGIPASSLMEEGPRILGHHASNYYTWTN